MNLAKIRQKARNIRLLATQTELPIVIEKELFGPGVSQDICFENENMTINNNFAVISNPFNEEHYPSRQEPKKLKRAVDPVEAILAGRVAAGCIEDQHQMVEESNVAESVEYDDFLCFRISNELYGIDIMKIKEIIKPKTITEVPHAPVFLPGVISLRGTIVPVIDMLNRLGFSSEPDIPNQRIVVVRSGFNLTGLLVDEVTQVVRIDRNGIESAPATLECDYNNFIKGIGRCDKLMIILLNLDSITNININ
jgi:purine-binding chemotaxis protein CheW